jgi:hypothetical protein
LLKSWYWSSWGHNKVTLHVFICEIFSQYDSGEQCGAWASFYFYFLFFNGGGFAFSYIFNFLRTVETISMNLGRNLMNYTTDPLQVLLYFKITFIKSLWWAYYVPFAVLLFLLWLLLTRSSAHFGDVFLHFPELVHPILFILPILDTCIFQHRVPTNCQTARYPW